MKNDLIAAYQLIKRGFKIFLSDKMSVFFSLLAPLIVLVLYILFLGDVQMSSIKSIMDDFGVEVESGALKAFVDNWMLAGVISVSCITVSFSAQNIIIRDKETGVIADALTSPVKRGVINISYLIYNFAVTMFICSVVLVVSFLYLLISGWYLSFLDVLGIIGIMILSVISASLLSAVLCANIKTLAAHGAVVGIMSAVIGFLIGAYMPLSIFPKAIQYAVLFIPGTYSAGVFRHLFMNGALAKISAVSPQAALTVTEAFSMNINLFGQSVSALTSLWIFLGLLVLTVAVYVFIQLVRSKKNKS